MALTDQEKSDIRYYLGYSDTSGATPLNFPYRAVQLLNQLDSQMGLLRSESEARVRDILTNLALVETKMESTPGHMAVSKVEAINLRHDEGPALEAEFIRWAHRLANLLGASVNVYAERFTASSPRLNVKVYPG